jgi:hypothetical protein
MTRALERRARRLLGIANELVAESKWTIWCSEPEHMPAMIDLLIAAGTLSESDRPHCLHWGTVRMAGSRQDDLGRIRAADAMLEDAGIRAATQQEDDSYTLEDAYRKFLGEVSAEHLRGYDEDVRNGMPRAFGEEWRASRLDPGPRGD